MLHSTALAITMEADTCAIGVRHC